MSQPHVHEKKGKTARVISSIPLLSVVIDMILQSEEIVIVLDWFSNRSVVPIMSWKISLGYQPV